MEHRIAVHTKLDETDILLGLKSPMSQSSKKMKHSRIKISVNEDFKLKKGKKLIPHSETKKIVVYALYYIKIGVK